MDGFHFAKSKEVLPNSAAFFYDVGAYLETLDMVEGM